MKFDNVLQTIGNTPVIRMNRLFGAGANVWIKSERGNCTAPQQPSAGSCSAMPAPVATAAHMPSICPCSADVAAGQRSSCIPSRFCWPW